MKDRKARKDWSQTIAIGAPSVTSYDRLAVMYSFTPDGRDRFLVEHAAGSDDAKRGRTVTVSQVLDGGYLRQLVAAARAAGWSE